MTFDLDSLLLEELNNILRKIQNLFTAHLSAVDPHSVYVLESTFDAKGDLIVGTADNTLAKLTVGANGTIPNALSTEATGIRWSTPLALTLARIKTGTYTGDGSTGLAITGVGFSPKFLWIFRHNLADAATHLTLKIDQTWADYAAYFQSSTSAVQILMQNDKINSLDADGFTVDDGGADAHPNTNTEVYDYIAIG